MPTHLVILLFEEQMKEMMFSVGSCRSILTPV